MKRMIVSGSSGLIGSEVCWHFGKRDWEIHGIDNNSRAVFLGPEADTRQNLERLIKGNKRYHHYELDIRDRAGIMTLVEAVSPKAIVHTAAQPSHDLSARIPFDDFDTNAVGTLNLLEATRRFSPEAVFIHMSTNKVYGDGPNRLPLKEMATRWDYADPSDYDGIDETFGIDQSKHSLFGASKVSADVIVQEYGLYFGMPTCCLRGGCLTGPNHSGVEAHGFLSYLIRCNTAGETYTIYGYKGKQVRDNIHSYDVARFVEAFLDNPRCGEVYNIGGGRENSCSILEAFDLAANISGKKMVSEYCDRARDGDHICYISNLAKIKAHYPGWDITKNLDEIFQEIYVYWSNQIKEKGPGV